jgi:hypothetical protein
VFVVTVILRCLNNDHVRLGYSVQFSGTRCELANERVRTMSSSALHHEPTSHRCLGEILRLPPSLSWLETSSLVEVPPSACRGFCQLITSVTLSFRLGGPDICFPVFDCIDSFSHHLTLQWNEGSPSKLTLCHQSLVTCLRYPDICYSRYVVLY